MPRIIEPNVGVFKKDYDRDLMDGKMEKLIKEKQEFLSKQEEKENELEELKAKNEELVSENESLKAELEELKKSKKESSDLTDEDEEELKAKSKK